MSYIRCLSNPERLYIFGDQWDRITIIHSVKPPMATAYPDKANSAMFHVPWKAFHAVCRRWPESGDGGVRSDGIRVREALVYLDTGKKVVRRVPPVRWVRLLPRQDRLLRVGLDADCRGRPVEYLIRFEYKKHFFHMWRVTWEYVVHGVVDRGEIKRGQLAPEVFVIPRSKSKPKSRSGQRQLRTKGKRKST
jgi:hypothetical protein